VCRRAGRVGIRAEGGLQALGRRRHQLRRGGHWERGSARAAGADGLLLQLVVRRRTRRGWWLEGVQGGESAAEQGEVGRVGGCGQAQQLKQIGGAGRDAQHGEAVWQATGAGWRWQSSGARGDAEGGLCAS
jgi:hypothetical protein